MSPPSATEALPASDTVPGERPEAAPGSDGDEAPAIGHIGRYALERRIGEGGLGTVYAARDPLLSRTIAIKTLNVAVAAESRASFDALFLNEARAAAGLSHPNIVTVFDAGVCDTGPYIAMELLAGRDLRQLRAEGWRAAAEQAATIVRRVADALAYAHAKGVVHRDIKPANIFMVARTQPRVLDFGIARIAHRHDLVIGDTVLDGDDALAAGSPYYMAPEQLLRTRLDKRGDVFSLGVVFYELLTGVKPFDGDSLEAISAAVLQHRPPLAHEVDAVVPPALSAIAARAMEKRPEDRYPSARAMSRALRDWLEQASAQPDATAGAPTPRRWARPAAALVLLAPLVAWLAWPQQEMQAPPSPPPSASAPTTPLAAPTERNDTPPLAVEADAAQPAPREPKRAAAASAATGVVQLAISPWGEVEVDGRAAGVAPPLTQLVLAVGPHTIAIRNGDFAPHVVKVDVGARQPINLKHRFR